MKNLFNYFAVNWKATSDNIRAYIVINGVSVEALADAMCRTKRTIDNWCSGRNNPSLDDLIFLAKFFNVDLLDILVTNGQLEETIGKQDYEEAHLKEEERHKQEKFCDGDTDFQFKYKEDIITAICFNEYVKSTYPATNLYEFLLFLPLIKPEILSDVLGRLLGNTQIKNMYIFTQLQRLYDSIKDEKAKAYVEFLRKFYFQYPSINIIDYQTNLENKIEKSEEHKKIMDSEDFDENYRAYVKQFEVFRQNLNFVSELKNRINSL